MSGSLQERKEQNVVLGFHPDNIRRVGKAERSHRNVGNSQQTELTSLTILTPLTFDAYKHAPFAPSNRAETHAMTAFAGGGGAKL